MEGTIAVPSKRLGAVLAGNGYFAAADVGAMRNVRTAGR
jgi:hypothetical protein